MPHGDGNASFGTAAAPHGDPVLSPPQRISPLVPAVVVLATALCAALITIYLWFEIIKVPLERPAGPLLDNPHTAPREGWAPWQIAPLASFALILALFSLYFRKAHRWTVLGLALAGVIAITVAF